jgi:magnesium transporter
MNTIYTTDSSGRLVGVMALRELLAAPEGAKVSEVAWQEVQTVPVTADREEVARVTREYDLVAVPVVDENGVIQGVVTVDDVTTPSSRSTPRTCAFRRYRRSTCRTSRSGSSR